MGERRLAVPREPRLLRGLDSRHNGLEQLVERERDMRGGDLVAERVHRDANGSSSRDAKLATDVTAKSCGSIEGTRVCGVARVDRRQGLVQSRDVMHDRLASSLGAGPTHRDGGGNIVSDVEGPGIVEERGAHRKA